MRRLVRQALACGSGRGAARRYCEALAHLHLLHLLAADFSRPTRRATALDFQENIAADRAALDDARRLGKGQRMSDSSAGALRRKVGGTKSGFFGEQVELKGKYADQGYVTTREAAPLPFVPFLVAVVLGIVAATVVVVAKTG